MPVQWKNRVLVAAVSPFFGGFMLWSIGKPLDTESVSERRPLAGFPALSGEAVLSGRFMKDFEQYTLDQFPMRDFGPLKRLPRSIFLARGTTTKSIFKTGLPPGWTIP